MYEQTALGEDGRELPYVFAVTPSGLVALEVVDNACPRPVPFGEKLLAAARERER